MNDARKRLDEAMNSRRLHLRKRWVTVAQQAGMSVQNLSLIRKGKIGLTEIAVAGLEDALQWPRGHIGKLLAESESTTRGRPLDPLTSSPEEIMAFLNEVRERFGEEEYRELYEGTIEVRRLAAEREHNAVTSKEHEEL